MAPMAAAKTRRVLLLTVFMLLLLTCSGSGGGGGNGTLGLHRRVVEVGSTEFGGGRLIACEGPMGECFEGEEELMDSEINRRLLASGGGGIGYDALKKEVPRSLMANKPGMSYRGCAPNRAYMCRPCSYVAGCNRPI
uniref:Uncharacterized protein n=1 Tax=Nymphaea colorata TaxID=210225 RepID=A0A5K0XEB1_9MAGN